MEAETCRRLPKFQDPEVEKVLDGGEYESAHRGRHDDLISVLDQIRSRLHDHGDHRDLEDLFGGRPPDERAERSGAIQKGAEDGQRTAD